METGNNIVVQSSTEGDSSEGDIVKDVSGINGNIRDGGENTEEGTVSEGLGGQEVREKETLTSGQEEDTSQNREGEKGEGETTGEITEDTGDDEVEEKQDVKSAVVSPKVLRPKLPDFKDNVQLKSGGHSRSKTDPGKGSEIKAIIDKTVEDIKVLNQVDFTKTYSRPKKFPKPFSQKSQSTHASPRASPTACSPCVDDSSVSSSLNRNRSRSLKILTDILKSGRGGVDYRSNNIPKDGSEEGKSISDSHLVPRKPSLVKEEECERRSSSDGQLGTNFDPGKTPISGGSSARDSGMADMDKTNYSTPEVPSPSEESKESKSPVRKKDFSKFRRAKSEVRKLTLSDDEGVGESDHDTPHTASYKPYHTIDTNSKFLALWKTGAPKRRTGFAGLVQSVYKQDDTSRVGDQPYLGPRKLHRVELKPIPTSRKISSLRHVTHPPDSKSTFREEGALDTNGFGTILKTSDNMDTSLPLPGELDLSKTSELSLADSQLGQSVSSETGTYQEALDSEIQEPCASDSEMVIEKRNGKSFKPKSRSDPSGDKSKESMDFPKVISSAHSSPLLSRSSEDEEEEGEGSESTIKNEDSSGVSEPIKDKGELRASLSLDESALENNKPNRDSIPECVTSPTGAGYESVKSSVKFLPFYSEEPSESSSPGYLSPTSMIERPHSHLEVPQTLNISKKGIGRSASSASVLVRERKNSAGKQEPRKHSLTPADEQVSDNRLHPLSDTKIESTSLPALNKPQKDKRFHIVEELYRNEQEYVEALTVLKDKYMLPLKNSSSVDENLVDNIFYMIPEILMHHTVYQNSLDKVWTNWDSKSTIGNVIVATFSKQTVIDCYLSFVENYKTSGKVIENALQTKSSVQKFIEQCHKDSGSKLTMKDLIVRPIQRIPRYELLIQRLIEHTPRDHPDFVLLKEAEKVMHDFAIKLGTVNETQHEEDQQESLKRLELLLITDLAVPERQYLRHDMVNIITKKDQCCVWMFSDLLIFSSVKRRSGPVTRKVSIILKSPTGQDFAENIKHKVWLRVGLHAVEIVKNQAVASQKSLVDPEQLEEDIATLNDINDLSNKLYCPHASLDEVVKEMLTSLGKQYSEIALRNSIAESNKLDILVTTQEGIYPLEISFNSAEKRAQWESTLYEAKQKLSMMSDKRAPEFLQALQITKTRAGMQFSCAAPIDGVNASGHRDVWVCNSDGYVGHMCLLSLQPEPIVTLNTPVPGCNARILCICAVPSYSGTFRRKSSAKKHQNRVSLPPTTREGPAIQIEEVDDRSGTEDEDGYQSDSESSDEESQEETIAEKEVDGQEGEGLQGDITPTTEDPGLEMKPLNVSEFTQSAPDSITCTGNWHQDSHKSTMWLGTEDGCIHIFQCTDNIKTTKNKLKIHHESPVYCIVYLDNKVFVSLANGDLIVYKRDLEGVWDSENPYTRSIGTAQSPITKMLAVAGKLWCGCQNIIKVINPLTLSTEKTFPVSSSSSRCIQSLVCSGQGVWLSSQQSSKVFLYHATSYEFLMEVGIAQAVSQKLQSADDIIRQHKAACLRITSLLVCKDLLWVGTSAGVILTVPIPRITSTTTRGTISTPSVTGLVYGHTGHVRFLTCVEMTASLPTSSNRQDNEGDDNAPDSLPVHDMHRRSSMAATTATLATRMLVISGGDGYEDFRSNASNEAAGRDDSTNHLLLWQV